MIAGRHAIDLGHRDIPVCFEALDILAVFPEREHDRLARQVPLRTDELRLGRVGHRAHRVVVAHLLPVPVERVVSFTFVVGFVSCTIICDIDRPLRDEVAGLAVDGDLIGLYLRVALLPLHKLPGPMNSTVDCSPPM